MQHKTTLGRIIFEALEANSAFVDNKVQLFGNETEGRYKDTLLSVAAEIQVSITGNPETLAAIIAELTEDFAQLHEPPSEQEGLMEGELNRMSHEDDLDDADNNRYDNEGMPEE